MAFVPVLLVLAASGWRKSFLMCLIFSLSIDAIDGFLARRLNQVTELGAKLDSWADAATWFTAVAGAWMLWPELISREWRWLAAAVATYVGAVIFGAVKYRRLTSYHTWGAKAAAVLMSVGGLTLFLTGVGWPLRVAASVLVLTCLEEMAITLALPAWRCGVPSLWHALCLRRQRSGLA